MGCAAKANAGKSAASGFKRGAGKNKCPGQFFSLDETDPKAPCYHINPTPNYRKNWQVRATFYSSKKNFNEA